MYDVIYLLFSAFFSVLALINLSIVLKDKNYVKNKKETILFLEVLLTIGIVLWIIVYTQTL